MKSLLTLGTSICVLCYSSFSLGSNQPMLTTEDTLKSSNSLKVSTPASETLELLIAPDVIHQRVKQIAAQIDKEYQGQEITIIMVMKGAVCIASDLMRSLNSPTTLEFIKASSYGMNGTKQGKLNLIGIENLDLKGKNVLLVDDIFDSGKTMSSIVAQLQEKQPKSLKTVVAFMKKVKRDIAYKPDYVLFEVENKFIVGYGLDYKERYRGLSGVYLVKNAE